MYLSVIITVNILKCLSPLRHAREHNINHQDLLLSPATIPPKFPSGSRDSHGNVKTEKFVLSRDEGRRKGPLRGYLSLPEGSEETADVEKACLPCENRANIHSHTRASGSLTNEKTFAEKDHLDLRFLTREKFNDGFI